MAVTSPKFQSVPVAKKFHWLLLSTAVALFSACSKNQGPASYEYLNAEHQINVDLAAEISREPKIPEPQKPVLPDRPTSQVRQEFLHRQQAYPRELAIYLNQVVGQLRRTSVKLETAQKKVGLLSAAGADPIAVRLVASHEALLGDARLAFLEASEFVRLNQQLLARDQHPDLVRAITSIATSTVHGLASGGLTAGILGGVDGILQLNAEATQFRQQLDGQLSRLNAATTNIERDKIRIQTIQGQAATILSGKYPMFNWSFVSH